MLRYHMAAHPATTLERDKEERVLRTAVPRQPQTRIIRIAKDIRAIIRFTHKVTTEKVVDIIARMGHLLESRQRTSSHHRNMVIVAKFIQTRIERYTKHQVVIHIKMHSTHRVRSVTSVQAVGLAIITLWIKVKMVVKGSKLYNQATSIEEL